MSRSAATEGNRNALLDLHFRECDSRTEDETQAHLQACADCREYVAELAALAQALRAWTDERPAAGLADQVLAHATRQSQPPRRSGSALPLLGLLPAMAAVLGVARTMGAYLTAWPHWQQLEGWPGVPVLGGFGVAWLLLLLAGGLGSLALAPALILESRTRKRSTAW